MTNSSETAALSDARAREICRRIAALGVPAKAQNRRATLSAGARQTPTAGVEIVVTHSESARRR
jgi:hypothetical protein